MRALWRHDRRWLCTCFVLLTLGLCATLSDTGPDHTWIRGIERRQEFSLVAALAGAFLLGLYAAARDRVTGTRDALLHRAVSPSRLAAARGIACLAVLGAAVLTAHGASYLGWLGQADHRAVWELTRAPAQLAMYATLLPFLAAGLYVGSLGGPPWLAILVAPVVVLPLLLLAVVVPFASVLQRAGADHVAWPLHVLLQALLALPLIVLVWPRLARAPDRDVGTSEARPYLHIALVGAGLCAFAWWGLRGIGSEAHVALLKMWPHVVRNDEGEVVRRVTSYAAWDAWSVDAEHRRLGPHPVFDRTWTGVDAEDEPWRAALRGFSTWLEPPDPRGSRLSVPRFEPTRNLPLAPREGFGSTNVGPGQVHRVRHADTGTWHGVFVPHPTAWAPEEITDWAPATRWPLQRADGRPLSTEASVVLRDGDPSSTLLDPTDGTLWQLPSSPRAIGGPLEPFLPAPGAPVLQARYREWTHTDERRVFHPNLLVETTAGWRALRAGGWEEATADWQPPDGQWTPPRRPFAASLHREELGDDPLDVVARLVDGDGHVVLEHRYAAKTHAERAAAHRMRAAALLTPPLAAGMARALGRDDGSAVELLMASGAHDGLLAANLLLGLLLAVFVRVRQGRMGVTQGMRRAWVLAVLLGGLAVFIAQFALVRPRAWRTAVAPRRARNVLPATPRQEVLA
jgi:hypothetical protein